MVDLPPPRYHPHPENCAGDFYVVDGCCITCGVPQDEAPEVFAWANAPYPSHCIVAHQPSTQASIDRTLLAMRSAEVDCIRYRGNDADISRRIVEIGEAAQCDLPPPADAAPLTRNHVSFRINDDAASPDAMKLAQDFLLHFKQSRTNISNKEARVKAPQINGRRTIVEVSWWQANYHMVEFERLDDRRWLVVTTARIRGAGIALSLFVDRWLRAGDEFHDLRWFSTEQWQAGGPFRLTVV